MSKADTDIGLIGLVLNIERMGFPISVYNRTAAKVDAFMNGRTKGKYFYGAPKLEDFVASLKSLRMIIMLVKAGPAVDELIEQLLPLLDKGDILIDGGLLFSKAEVDALNELAAEAGHAPIDAASLKSIEV